MFDFQSSEVQFALQAVHQAALLVQQIQRELVTTSLTKDDRSPVTVADFASQALVGHLLAHTFPADPLVAEENSASLREPSAMHTLQQVTDFVKRFIPQADPPSICEWIDHNRMDTSPRFWTLDPIDGTKGFLRGDQYAIALALIVDGKVQLGVLGCPNLDGVYQPKSNRPGCVVVAVRGHGTWAQSLQPSGDLRPLRVSSQSNPCEAVLLRSFESGHTNTDQIDRFAERLSIRAKPLSLDSQAKYALMAAGKGDLLLRLLSPSKPDYREKIWDQAAGSIVLEEAGGRISDLDGVPLDFTTGRSLLRNRGILASNGLLHTPALEALRAIGA